MQQRSLAPFWRLSQAYTRRRSLQRGIQAGAVLVEFVIIVSLFLPMFVFGVIEIGNLAHKSAEMKAAAFEGARAGSRAFSLLKKNAAGENETITLAEYKTYLWRSDAAALRSIYDTLTPEARDTVSTVQIFDAKRAEAAQNTEGYFPSCDQWDPSDPMTVSYLRFAGCNVYTGDELRAIATHPNIDDYTEYLQDNHSGLPWGATYQPLCDAYAISDPECSKDPELRGRHAGDAGGLGFYGVGITFKYGGLTGFLSRDKVHAKFVQQFEPQPIFQNPVPTPCTGCAPPAGVGYVGIGF